MRTGLGSLAIAIAMTACYRPELDRCRVTCADFCPGADTCLSDGYCHAAGDTELCMADVAIRALSAGDRHACAIDAATRLLCWGDNHDVQTGVGAGTRRLLIGTEIEGPAGATGWTAVDGGQTHSCGLQGDRLLCWGDNDRGESGRTGGGQVVIPTAPLDSGAGWIAVSAGSRFSCGIRASGAEHHLICWGADFGSQLGNGPGDDSGGLLWAADTTSEGTFTDWAEVSAGDYHACARRAGGEVYCWGLNAAGAVGDGTDEGERARPTRIAPAMGDGQRAFRSISAGSDVTCAISADSRLYCWGENSYGRLGMPVAGVVREPRRVGTDADWTAIAVGPSTVCGLRAAGLRCWGKGEAGAIGDGDWLSRDTPTAVAGLALPSLVAVGYDFACAAPPDGGVMCWGANHEGELGNSITSTKHEPTAIAPTDRQWTRVAAGQVHTCGVHAGDVRCWGWNGDGNLDGRRDEGALTPTTIDLGAGAGAVAREIGVGLFGSCALVEAGGSSRPYCWGSDAYGQVGDGPPAGGHKTPTAIGTAGAWSHLSVGPGNATALLGADRRVWGEPMGFGLGNGDDTTVVVAPSDPADAIDWTTVGLGSRFGCGLESMTGAIHCWGTDQYQQQGDGAAMSPAARPRMLAAGGGYKGLAAAWNGSHACAITMTDGLVCWGRTDLGQAGQDGTTVDVPTPVRQSGSGWTAVAGGPHHTCGVRADELYCWGNNGDAQLGNQEVRGLTVEPVRVGQDDGWTSVSAGQEHTCGLRDGNLYCWGRNTHGQIGDGTRSANVPGPVILPAP